ncbi:MAG: hypothetical protein E7Z87_05700 [Cyanobacteria bacterium SIG26]|nr:hypothetical protein [Cyanobacteria bacterium SIG26]
MFYNVLKAKDIIELGEEKYKKETLLQKEDSSFNIVALKKDEIIDTHTAIADAALYMIDGEIEIHFDAEKFKLDKGEIIMFKKDCQHKVWAKKDSKFFIIKV